MKALKIALVATVAFSAAAPTFAQSSYQPTQQYREDLNRYQEDRADYRAARADYERRLADYEAARASYDRRYGYGAYARRYGAAPTWDTAWDANRYSSNVSDSSYDAARADYERRLADYEAARASYDRRYGYGAYARRYGPAPTWDTAWDANRYSSNVSDASYDAARRDYERRLDQYERDRASYDRRNGYGAYARRYGPPPSWDANSYGVNTSYTDPCRGRTTTNTVAGGLIGALAGAALGSNVAARNARPEGAVLGAVVGGAIGAGIGKSTAKCDDTGYYYSYDQTIPYRESAYDRSRSSGRYDYSYYERQRCRLAPAPVDDRGEDYRYVRVCPDSSGRYRITG